MRRYMFGLDPADWRGSAGRLRGLGYDAAVLPPGDEAAFRAAADAGLETWLCFGAHAIGDFAQREWGAKDARGDDAPWFDSACPNAAAVNERNLGAALAFAGRVDGLAGVFVDGARFASFASLEGVASFFGCFCDRCMARMEALGYDARAIRSGVRALSDHLDGGGGDPAAMRAAVDSWLDFRAACVGDYMAAFAAAARAKGLRAGAFVFAPSLWRLVGQRPDALIGLDLVAPMLYRAYPHPGGPACLSHEWAALKRLLSRSGRPAEAAALLGVKLPPGDPMAGFLPARIGSETAAARAQLPHSVALKPIVQAEDDALDETVDRVLAAGADGCGEFMYTQKFPRGGR
ncbi:MAG: hypothetical protein GX558_05555 [Clostridiales bacterium]|nr:hypothetical protein [Clostridiales bacterium]